MIMESMVGRSPLIFVKDLSKRFGPDWALARASFHLEGGKLALLTGANGSGKTTLINCLSTALVPDYGSGSVAGNDLVTGRDEVRRRVASLNQPPGFYGGLSARENLALANRVLNLSRDGALEGVLNRVGLGSKQDMPLDAFSSGMKQRFALARLTLLKVAQRTTSSCRPF